MSRASLPPSLDVALVGRRMPGTENIALGCLHAACEGSGVKARTFEVSGAQDVKSVAESILSAAPRIVGFSLSDGTSCVPLLALGEMLWRRGYRGHCTAGGAFATVAREWLLKRYPWLDSVVRFAGEEPLVGLALAVRVGATIQALPAVTTRRGDGLPAPVASTLPMRTWPLREELSTVAGHPVACVIASRGCPGRCAYCGPAALQQHEAAEALRAGLTRGQILEAGIATGRHRSTDDLCDELAELWHDRGVRYVSFADEHMLPWNERDAFDFVNELRRGMKRRKILGLGFGATLRADCLTERLVDALADAGLIRIFLGLEFASDTEAKQFGRRSRPEHTFRLLERLKQLGVASIGNLMIVHPDSTSATIRQGIGLLEALPAGVIEPIRMMPWHGTELCDRLRDEGRLVGNPIRYDYALADPVVAKFARLHGRIRLEALGNYSPAFRVHDAELAARLSERLEPGRQPHAVRRLSNLRARVATLYAGSMASAWRLSSTEAPELDAMLIARVRREADALTRQMEDVERTLLARRAQRPTFSPGRAAAAGAIVFCTVAAAACGGQAHEQLAPPSVQDAGSEADAFEAATDVSVDARQETCTTDRLDYEEAIVRAEVESDEPCFNGSIAFGGDAGLRAYTYYEAVNEGTAFRWKPCSDDAEKLLMSAQRVESLVESLDLPCLKALEEDGRIVRIRGGMDAEVENMLEVLELAWCGYPYGVTLVIGDDGRVEQVLGPEVEPETLHCIAVAMQGLIFPCLAGTEVCSAHATVDY
jgi:Radical SAM superfamily/B12 binding domain